MCQKTVRSFFDTEERHQALRESHTDLLLLMQNLVLWNESLDSKNYKFDPLAFPVVFYENKINSILSLIEGVFKKDKNNSLHTIAPKIKQSLNQIPKSSSLQEMLDHSRTIVHHLGEVREHIVFQSQKYPYLRLNKIYFLLIFSGVIFFLIVGLSFLTIQYYQKTSKAIPDLILSLRDMSLGKINGYLKVDDNSSQEIFLLVREYNRALEALREREKKIKKNELEILKKERLAAIGEFSSEIVHEIRNPLNAMSLNMDLLCEALQGANRDVLESLESICREINRLYDITESYLVRARKTCASDRTTIDLHNVITDVIDFNEEEYKHQNIYFIKNFDSSPLFVRCDASRMKQVFINLFKNAKEAMPQGGTIRLITSCLNNTYQIRCEDTGYGMNDITKRNVFQSFFTTKQEGTGLGLVLVKNIIEEHHGHIECESQLGKGTTFIIKLPM